MECEGCQKVEATHSYADAVYCKECAECQMENDWLEDRFNEDEDTPCIHELTEQEEWLFSFGYGQAHPNKYVRIKGSWSEARDEMVRRHGIKWAFQYHPDKEQELNRNFMTELKE
jgi:hypothetical protein